MTNQQTIDTYNNSAAALAEYFQGIGARTHDINLAFKLAGHPSRLKVVEIGCGDGRDAMVVCKLTDSYTGFDISKGMIEIARRNVPKAIFEVADALTYDYPKDLDIVFAFASLLHLDKESVKNVIAKVHQSLKTGGIMYISLKYSANYHHENKHDTFGERLFYFYNPELIEQLAEDLFKTVATSRKKISHTEWFVIALQKL